MLVELPTVAQAARVAAATGGRHLPGQEEGTMSRRVEAGGVFEARRPAVEAVSVLFKLFDDSGGEVVQVPSGWTVAGARFEVEWPADPSVVRSHFGARRFAYNWARAKVTAGIDAKKANPGHQSAGWSLAELRKEWNRVKDQVAPWWGENSKEAYAAGIADLVAALDNWRASKNGQRKGRKAGFPKFRSRRTDRARVRFTTGAMRLEADRRTIVVPVIGALRSKENTRRVQRHLAKGNARALNMTVSERWGRLFVSVNYAIRTPGRRPVAKPGVRAGVDLGLRTLATVADTEGNIVEFPNPAPLRATLAGRRAAGRELSRRIPGSKGHGRAKAKLARLDRKAVHLRREAWHQLTTWLAATYEQAVKEGLDIAAMKRSMGRRAFRRAVSDAALGMFGPILQYKAERTGAKVITADRWFASSQIHHGCGCRLIAPSKLARQLACAVTGELADRDRNASLNLRDWPETNASPGLVEASAPADPGPPAGGTDPGPDAGISRRRGSDRQTPTLTGRAGRGEAITNPAERRARNPERGAA